MKSWFRLVPKWCIGWLSSSCHWPLGRAKLLLHVRLAGGTCWVSSSPMVSFWRPAQDTWEWRPRKAGGGLG
eukprot:456941-Amphidinium_carterae.1